MPRIIQMHFSDIDFTVPRTKLGRRKLGHKYGLMIDEWLPNVTSNLSWGSICWLAIEEPSKASRTVRCSTPRLLGSPSRR